MSSLFLDAFEEGEGPKRLGPPVPFLNSKYKSVKTLTTGAKNSKEYHPERPTSWNLLMDTWKSMITNAGAITIFVMKGD